jgi:hypothetical protein
MEQVLRLNWPRCPDGYDLVQFDRRKVDWEKYSRDENPNQQQLSKDEQRFLAVWGEHLTIFRPGDEEEQWFLARTKRITKPDIIAKEPRLFAKFAEAKSNDLKQIQFVNEHGLLFHNCPCSLSTINYWATTMSKLIAQRDSEKRRKDSSWLKATMKHFQSGLGSNIDIDPEIHEGDMRLILKPADLIIAMLIQFIFTGSKAFLINQCLCCGNYIPKGPKQNRVDRKYCSNACRQRNFRKQAR